MTDPTLVNQTGEPDPQIQEAVDNYLLADTLLAGSRSLKSTLDLFKLNPTSRKQVLQDFVDRVSRRAKLKPPVVSPLHPRDNDGDWDFVTQLESYGSDIHLRVNTVKMEAWDRTDHTAIFGQVLFHTAWLSVVKQLHKKKAWGLLSPHNRAHKYSMTLEDRQKAWGHVARSLGFEGWEEYNSHDPEIHKAQAHWSYTAESMLQFMRMLTWTANHKSLEKIKDVIAVSQVLGLYFVDFTTALDVGMKDEGLNAAAAALALKMLDQPCPEIKNEQLKTAIDQAVECMRDLSQSRGTLYPNKGTVTETELEVLPIEEGGVRAVIQMIDVLYKQEPPKQDSPEDGSDGGTSTGGPATTSGEGSNPSTSTSGEPSSPDSDTDSTAESTDEGNGTPSEESEEADEDGLDEGWDYEEEASPESDSSDPDAESDPADALVDQSAPVKRDPAKEAERRGLRQMYGDSSTLEEAEDSLAYNRDTPEMQAVEDLLNMKEYLTTGSYSEGDEDGMDIQMDAPPPPMNMKSGPPKDRTNKMYHLARATLDMLVPIEESEMVQVFTELLTMPRMEVNPGALSGRYSGQAHRFMSDWHVMKKKQMDRSPLDAAIAVAVDLSGSMNSRLYSREGGKETHGGRWYFPRFTESGETRRGHAMKVHDAVVYGLHKLGVEYQSFVYQSGSFYHEARYQDKSITDINSLPDENPTNNHKQNRLVILNDGGTGDAMTLKGQVSGGGNADFEGIVQAAKFLLGTGKDHLTMMFLADGEFTSSTVSTIQYLVRQTGIRVVHVNYNEEAYGKPSPFGDDAVLVHANPLDERQGMEGLATPIAEGILRGLGLMEDPE